MEKSLSYEQNGSNEGAQAGQWRAWVKGCSRTFRSTSRGSSAAGGRRVGIGVGCVVDAIVDALDDLVGLVVIEQCANVLSACGFDGGAAADISELWKLNSEVYGQWLLPERERERERETEKNLLGECTGEVDSTNNDLESWEASDAEQVGVVGDLEASANSLQVRHGDVVQVGAIHNCKCPIDESQVGCGE